MLEPRLLQILKVPKVMNMHKMVRTAHMKVIVRDSSIHPTISSSVYLAIQPSSHLSVHPFFYPSIHSSIHPIISSVQPFVHPPKHLPICLSIHLLVQLLSIYPSMNTSNTVLVLSNINAFYFYNNPGSITL